MSTVNEPSANGTVHATLEESLRAMACYLEAVDERLERQQREAEEARAAAEEAKTRRKVEIEVVGLPKVKLKDPPHPQLERVVKILSARDRKGFRLPVLLIGPSGAGKTFLSEQAAKILKLEFASVSCSAGMSEGQLLGRLLPTGAGGRFEYSESPFVHAFENGGLFLLSEVDAADANTLLVLNTAVANGYLSVPNRIDKPVARRHKDFALVADANTVGAGADRQYVGRNQLDEAFLDRFRVGQVMMDYAPEIEEYLCPDDELRGRIQHYRNNILKAPPGSRVRRIISTRFLEQAYAAKHSVKPGLTDKEIDAALFGGWTKEEVEKVTVGWVSKAERDRLAKEQAAKEKERLAQEKEKAEREEALKLETEDDPFMHKRERDDDAPLCPTHGVSMVRMLTGRGYRCAVPGNRYVGDGRWSKCSYCVWDKDRKRGDA